MKVLFIHNDAPYGTERSYNALRLARSPLKAGGISEADLVNNAFRSSMDELTVWTKWSDKVIVF